MFDYTYSESHDSEVLKKLSSDSLGTIFVHMYNYFVEK